MPPEPGTQISKPTPEAAQSALIDLVRSGVEIQGPQKHPTAEVARLAFHLERIAAELTVTRESLAHTKGELEASQRTESYSQKYLDKFEEKSSARIKSLEAKLEEISQKFNKANLQIAELRTALEISNARNKQLEEKSHPSALPAHRGLLNRILHPHAQA